MNTETYQLYIDMRIRRQKLTVRNIRSYWSICESYRYSLILSLYFRFFIDCVRPLLIVERTFAHKAVYVCRVFSKEAVLSSVHTFKVLPFKQLGIIISYILLSFYFDLRYSSKMILFGINFILFFVSTQWKMLHVIPCELIYSKK